jgi:hypothetical protein
MEKIENMDRVYTFSPKTGYTEYTGGPNFVNGMRPCTNQDCKGTMNREPLDQTYIPAHKGKILVNTSSTNGRMTLHTAEVDYVWMCPLCNETIQAKKKKPITHLDE